MSKALVAGHKLEDLTTAQLDAYIVTTSFDKLALRNLAKGDFWDRFELCPQAGIRHPESGHRLLATCAYRISERSRSGGRYAVWLIEEPGKLTPFYRWETDKFLVKLFQDAGQTLPHKGVWKMKRKMRPEETLRSILLWGAMIASAVSLAHVIKRKGILDP